MDFQQSPEDLALREEIRDFVQQNWDDGRYHMNDVSNASWHLDDPEALEAAQGFAKKLVDKGWYTMHWPAEHGGQDAPFTADADVPRGDGVSRRACKRGVRRRRDYPARNALAEG